jgi:type I restriction enzyme R subunit
MYVDKKLRGVAAVQTLSRLNRIYPPYDKKTFILDFVNTYEDIEKAFAPYYTFTILKDTVTPSDIRKIEMQIDNYGFLDFDDINSFNEYLYQEKRTSKDKEKAWALLDKSVRIIKKNPVNVQFEIKAAIRSFTRFYSFLIQATSYEDIDLHKKYNFLSYLVKEIDITAGNNDFDIADKITVSFNKPKKKTETASPDIKSIPEVELPKPDEIFIGEEEKKKLSEIIDEINARYGKHFDTDVATKAALQIRDILLKDDKLKTSAKANTFHDFETFSYTSSIDNALNDGYEQNEDFFSLLLNNEDAKKKLLGVFVQDVYKTLRTDKSD